MATEVLLMTDVQDLGAEGDVVSVADGYARNYLLPKKMAEPVTAAARSRLEKLRKDRDQAMRVQRESAEIKAKQLANVSCTIAVKTSEDEKLYGSVSAADIVDSLKSQGIELDRHTLVLENPIKELGVFDVAVRLHPEVGATIKVWVVQE
jgi:large subunit ribosomal protein L9